MAQFCTKCGTAIPEGMKFCTGCGATIGETSATVADAPAAPPPAVSNPSPAAPAATAPAASSGSPVLKIVLIVLAVLVFLGLLSVGSCVYFIYRAKQRVTQFEKQVHATYPVPTATPQAPAQTGTPASPGPSPVPVVDLGVPIYPGATASEGGGQLSLGAGGIKVQQFTTSDSVDKVAAFYKEKLGAKEVVSLSPGSAMVQGLGANGVVTTVTIATDSGTGKTQFTLTSIAKQ